MKLAIILTIWIVSFSIIEASFWGLDWVWSKNDDAADDTRPKVKGMTMVKVPFEAKTDDEKFLEEAKKYTSLKLSELDSCQHKVIMQITTSCSDMTEEQLAKLSVNLLNCQSAVEGRQQFPCTEDMTLRQCTSAMDSDMWNTYHLMNNRARAVCYAARHQQFRALSEMTVNKLMNSAHDQIRAMNTLKEGQEKLETLTAGTMDTVAAGQEALLKQQERMRVTQQNLRDFVSLNLHQLTKEKALIAAGHQQLSKLTEDIKAKLDAAGTQLALQSLEQNENHQEVLRDLKTIQEQASTIWKEIERSTMAILAQHQSAAAQYEETLNKLSKINDTVTFLLQVMETTRQELDERLGWLSGVVGAAGIYMFVLHALYLLIGMVATAFLQASTVTKFALISIVPLNLAVIYNQGRDAALCFTHMTIVIITIATVHWLFLHIYAYWVAWRKLGYEFRPQLVVNGFTPHTVVPSSPVHLSLKSRLNLCWKTVREAWIACTRWWKSWLFSKPSVSCGSVSGRSKVSDYEDNSSDSDEEYFKSEKAQTVVDSPVTPLRQRIYHSLPTPSRTPSRSGSPVSSHPGTPRPLCQAKCRTGLLCRNISTPGSDMCRIHSLNSSQQ
ncbi:protein brambleberry [Anabrus simplex]|uniref:protein brambleberry n=1 Tax=Anabrus simplex TaxID=316456 RepID=UPI0035A2EA4E